MTHRMSAGSERLLEIYLADHLAAATAGVALARRAARSNATNAFGDALRRLTREIEDDRRTLRGIVAELGFEDSKAKNAAAWLGEHAGRLKLNGQLRGYSPLSRLVELETLSVGVAGKVALWSHSGLCRASADVSPNSIWRNLPSAASVSAMPSRNSGCALPRRHSPRAAEPLSAGSHR